MLVYVNHIQVIFKGQGRMS